MDKPHHNFGPQEQQRREEAASWKEWLGSAGREWQGSARRRGRGLAAESKQGLLGSGRGFGGEEWQ